MTDDELRELKYVYCYDRNDCKVPIHRDVHQLIAEIERLQALEVLALTALAETRDAVRIAATASPSCGRTWREIGDDEVESYIRAARAMAAEAAGGQNANES